VHESFWASNFSIWQKFITVLLFYYVSTFIKVKVMKRVRCVSRSSRRNLWMEISVTLHHRLVHLYLSIWETTLFCLVICTLNSELSLFQIQVFIFLVLSSFGVIVCVNVIALFLPSIQEFLQYEDFCYTEVYFLGIKYYLWHFIWIILHLLSVNVGLGNLYAASFLCLLIC